MNTKVTFVELVELMAEASSTTTRVCELFLREFSAVVSQALIDGESVRVKGVGTFKVTKVKPRKSVDVSTGKANLIQGYSKISFTPDKVLADAVNQPFAQFETVLLDDAVTDEKLAEIDRQHPSTVDTPHVDQPVEVAADTPIGEDEMPAAPLPFDLPEMQEPAPAPSLDQLLEEIPEDELLPVQPVEAKPVEAKPKEAKPKEEKPAQAKPVEEKPKEEKPAQTKPVEAKPEEKKPAQAKPVEEKPKEEKPAQAKPVEEKPKEKKPAQAKPAEEKPKEEKPAQPKPVEEKPKEEKPAEEKPTTITDPVTHKPMLVGIPIDGPSHPVPEEPKSEEPQPDRHFYRPEPRNVYTPTPEQIEAASRKPDRRWLWTLLGVLAAALLVWLIARGCSDTGGNQEPHEVVAADTIPDDSLDNDEVPAVKAEPKAEAKPESKPEVKPESKPEAKPESKPEVKAESKSETKTETKSEPAKPAKPKEVTDVVTSQIVLTTLSEKHYGSPWFWVYIYEENVKRGIINDPNNIRPGTRVVIPPAEKYGINPKDKASLKKAQQKSWQYLKDK